MDIKRPGSKPARTDTRKNKIERIEKRKKNNDY